MKEKRSKAWWEAGLRLFAQVSGWIVFPIITAIYLGRWLDQKYDKEPWLFLTCVIVAFIITNVGIVLVSLRSIKEMKEEESKENKSQDNYVSRDQ